MVTPVTAPITTVVTPVAVVEPLVEGAKIYADGQGTEQAIEWVFSKVRAAGGIPAKWHLELFLESVARSGYSLIETSTHRSLSHDEIVHGFAEACAEFEQKLAKHHM